MSVSHSTVRNLLSGEMLKLGVNNRAGAIAKARQLGLITPHQPENIKSKVCIHLIKGLKTGVVTSSKTFSRISCRFSDKPDKIPFTFSYRFNN